MRTMSERGAHGYRVEGHVGFENAHGGWSDLRVVPVLPRDLGDDAYSPAVRLLWHERRDAPGNKDLTVVLERPVGSGGVHRPLVRIGTRQPAGGHPDHRVFYLQDSLPEGQVDLEDLESFLALSDVQDRLARFVAARKAVF